ncbi:MAG: hypothetical protein ACRDSZ_08260 [Pseudonocardiaceae bacterium]
MTSAFDPALDEDNPDCFRVEEVPVVEGLLVDMSPMGSFCTAAMTGPHCCGDRATRAAGAAGAAGAA